MKRIHKFVKTGGAIAAIAMLASSVTAQPQPRIENAIAFQQDTVFQVQPGSESIFDAMWSNDSVNVPELGLRRISHSEANADGWVQNEMQIGAEWNGLYMTKLGYDGVRQSGIGAYRMHFAESAAKVRNKMRDLGMKLDGKDDDSFCDTEAQVKPDGNGSVLYISFIC